MMDMIIDTINFMNKQTVNYPFLSNIYPEMQYCVYNQNFRNIIYDSCDLNCEENEQLIQNTNIYMFLKITNDRESSSFKSVIDFLQYNMSSTIS